MATIGMMTITLLGAANGARTRAASSAFLIYRVACSRLRIQQKATFCGCFSVERQMGFVIGLPLCLQRTRDALRIAFPC